MGETRLSAFWSVEQKPILDLAQYAAFCINLISFAINIRLYSLGIASALSWAGKLSGSRLSDTDTLWHDCYRLLPELQQNMESSVQSLFELLSLKETEIKKREELKKALDATLTKAKANLEDAGNTLNQTRKIAH